MSEQKISCPNCDSPIIFEVKALLIGASFECGSCEAKIKLTEESKEIVSKSMSDFEKLKSQSLK